MPSTPPDSSVSRPDTRVWRLAAALGVVLIAISLARVLGGPETGTPAADRSAEPPAGGVVTVGFEAPGTPLREQEVAWSAGQTVADATDAAGLEAWWRGSGEMAFLEAIAGAVNEGAGGRNWQYDVNGERATRGAGAVTLRAGDRVLWKFAPYE